MRLKKVQLYRITVVVHSERSSGVEMGEKGRISEIWKEERREVKRTW